MRGDGEVLSPFDLKRLQSYANNVCDHHMIQDLVPALARAYFAQRIPVNLSYGQAAILLCVGLQHGDISRVEASLNLPANQVREMNESPSPTLPLTPYHITVFANGGAI